MFTAAAAQVEPVPLDVGANVALAAGLVDGAGADLIVFPELSLTGYDLAAIESRDDLHVAPDDPRLAPLRAACERHGTTAIVGAPVPTGRGLLLGALTIGPDGSAPDVYGKLNLHADEPRIFVPGTGPRVVDVAGRLVGLALCIDANLPEHAAATAELGAEIYAAGVIFELGTEDRLAEHLGARARETGMWVVGAQPSGRTGSFETGGTSGIWAPDGEAVTRLGDEAPALASASIPGPA